LCYVLNKYCYKRIVSVSGNQQPMPAGGPYDWLACGTPLGCKQQGKSSALFSKWRRRLND